MIEIGSDKYIVLTGLEDSITDSYVNDATVTWALETPSGTSIATGVLTYETASDGKYEGQILAATTATLTDLAEYVLIVTATKSGNIQKFVERMVAISTTGNWLRFSSHYFDELGTLSDSQAGVITTKIKASQEAIEKYCNRTFAETAHDEIIRTQEDGSLVLNQFPVISFKRLYDRQRSVLTVANSTAQISNCSTTASALTLSTVTSGVETNTSLAYATYPTLTTLAAAIDLISGWSTTISSGWGSFPSADLVAFQHTSVKTSGYLYIWEQATGNRFQVEESTGIVKDVSFGRRYPIRCVFTAGFSDVPELIKSICASLAMNAYDGSVSSVKQESLGDYSFSVASAVEQLEKLPITNKMILNQYRDRRI